MTLQRVLALKILVFLAPLSACSEASSGGCVTVRTNTELISALRNDSITTLLVAAQSEENAVSISFSQRDFITPVILRHGRQVRVASDDVNRRAWLDFNFVPAAILLQGNASMVVEGLSLVNFASRSSVPAAQWPYVQDVGFIAWPTIIAEPGSSFTFNDTHLSYYSSKCALLRDAMTYGLIYGPENVVAFDNHTILFRNGTSSLPVSQPRNNETVGNFRLSFFNLYGTCQEEAAAAAPATARAHQGSRAWVAPLAGSLAGALALLLCSFALLLWWRRRRRNRTSQKDPEVQKQSPVGRIMTSSSNANMERSGSVETVRSSASLVFGSADSGALPRFLLQQRLGSADLEQVRFGPVLGRGSFGTVYKGRWQGALVAVKVVQRSVLPEASPEARQQAQQCEFMVSLSASHPNIVSTYKILVSGAAREGSFDKPADPGGGSAPNHEAPAAPASLSTAVDNGTVGGSDGGSPRLQTLWFLMEYCDGGTLLRAIEKGIFRRQGGEVNMTSIILCLIDVARGLQYLHECGVVHGDLKPANVLIQSTRTGRRGFECKLSDFGLSRVLVDQQTHLTTRSGGTPSYMPPELLREGILSPCADVYSFAMLMYQLYTGQVPFGDSLHLGEVLYAVGTQQRPEVPAGCPTKYAELMRLCWAADSAARPKAREIVECLKSMLP